MRALPFVIAVLAICGLTACQGRQFEGSGPSTYVPSSSAAQPADVQQDAMQSPPSSTQTLYVATQNRIDVYTPGATSPRLIISGGLAGVTQIAIDAVGKRYAANFGTPNTYADSSVTEYRRGQTSPTMTRTNGAFSAAGVAVDLPGDVFASSYYRNTVSVYRPGSVNPFLQLTNGIVAPGLLAFNDGELYVGEAGSGQAESAKILRFPFGSTSPDLTLTLKAPGSLPPGALTYGGPFVIAKNGTAYAGGAVIANDLGVQEFVNVFAPGQAWPRASVVVSTGPSAGSAPYVAAQADDLYVSASDVNSAFQYEVGSKLKLIRTIMGITNGLNKPGPIAVDASHRLYVGNASGSVTVYAPGATTPSQTITLPDFAAPVGVVIGP